MQIFRMNGRSKTDQEQPAVLHGAQKLRQTGTFDQDKNALLMKYLVPREGD
jgi:hypothetical protein